MIGDLFYLCLSSLQYYYTPLCTGSKPQVDCQRVPFTHVSSRIICLVCIRRCCCCFFFPHPPYFPKGPLLLSCSIPYSRDLSCHPTQELGVFINVIHFTTHHRPLLSISQKYPRKYLHNSLRFLEPETSLNFFLILVWRDNIISVTHVPSVLTSDFLEVTNGETV